MDKKFFDSITAKLRPRKTKNIIDVWFPIERDPHIVSEVICVKCGKRWIAVRPAETLLKSLECENCGSGYVIETGEAIDIG